MAKSGSMELKYLTGAEGHYLRRKTPIFESVVRINRNPNFPKIEECLRFTAKKIPGNVFRQWQAFARAVAAKYKSGVEAALMLFYHPEKKEWQAWPPRQRLSTGSVDFSGVTETLRSFRYRNGPEWLLAGTFHSHPGSSSSPSYTDVKDETAMDGIHIIVPKFGEGGDSDVTIHATSGGTRFRFSDASHVVDFAIAGELPFPPEWMGQINMHEPPSPKPLHEISTHSLWPSDDLRSVRRFLRRCGFDRREGKDLLAHYPGFFEQALELLKQLSEIRMLIRKLPGDMWEKEVILGDIGYAREALIELAEEAGRCFLAWREPDGGKEKDSKEEQIDRYVWDKWDN